MKNKLLIPLIAFIVACVALLFSIVTFIRTIIRGELIWIGALQVTGTALIVGVCAITMYLVRSAYEEDEENEEDEEDNEYDTHETTDNLENTEADGAEKTDKSNKKKKNGKNKKEQSELDEVLLSDLPKVDED